MTAHKKNLLRARINYALKIIFTFVENRISRIRLKNDNFTIICGTCAGGVICHKLGKQFLSPTVNLWFKEKDIIKMVSNLKHYMEVPLRFVNSEYPYPSAMCDDIQIFFNHAKTNEEAEELWNRRRVRVNYDNVWVISSDNGIDYEDMKAFAQLPCQGKVMFTAKEYPEFDFVLPFKEYEKEKKISVGTYMSHHSRILDRFIFEKYFDYVTWLNTGKINKKTKVFF